MVVAAASVAAIAASLRRKSNIASPFFHPAFGCGVALVVATMGAAMRGAFPLASALVSGTSIVVALAPLLILCCRICLCVRGKEIGDNSKLVMKMAGYMDEPYIYIYRNQKERVGLNSRSIKL